MKAIIFMVLLLPSFCDAQVFKCKAANGRITYSSKPCLTDQKKQALELVKDTVPTPYIQQPAVSGSRDWARMKREKANKKRRLSYKKAIDDIELKYHQWRFVRESEWQAKLDHYRATGVFP